MRADFMDKDAAGTETKLSPAPALLQRSTNVGGGELVTAPIRPRVCGFRIDPNSVAPRDLDPWTSMISGIVKVFYIEYKNTIMRLKMSIQIIPDLNELSGIRSTVLEHQYLRSFTGGLLLHRKTYRVANFKKMTQPISAFTVWIDNYPLQSR
uniref:Uncharacterized protein n=1 Tax=Oryza punctata TaxID=4537 RepID=A0A0E0L0U9_ORYPU